jgi:hypothetical protein
MPSLEATALVTRCSEINDLFEAEFTSYLVAFGFITIIGDAPDYCGANAIMPRHGPPCKQFALQFQDLVSKLGKSVSVAQFDDLFVIAVKRRWAMLYG